MRSQRVVVVGAGIGGLVAAVELAARGEEVLVLEQAAAPGGKMRAVRIDGQDIDAGPTVFTMRWVFEEIFAAAGSSLTEHLTLKPIEVLARHAWADGARLDLYADPKRSAEAIGAFAGAPEAKRFLAFCERTRSIYMTLENSFIRAPSPTPLSLVRHAGLRGLRNLAGISPFATLWGALGEYFHDPRLRQLFGRYATYCGSSPFLAPATLMLIAHVEQDGVWLVEGGMHRVARALEALGVARGATYRYGTTVDEILVEGGRAAGVLLGSGERIDARAVIANTDVAALADGRLGAGVRQAVALPKGAMRSLSAVTWNMVARTRGFPLVHHNVFFSPDYKAEFAALFEKQRLPATPTVYICAQDRSDVELAGATPPERLLCLANAPAYGDQLPVDLALLEHYEERTFAWLEQCGLSIERSPARTVRTAPHEFERLFPATGGALYGRASHGWNASFARPGAASLIPALYLAGGSTHPGAGVPMAALSGRSAAQAVIAGAA
jgi:1-hydroxycarotenoid 3,4-desaturase